MRISDWSSDVCSSDLTIFQKALTAAIIGNPTKDYNGTTRAVAGPANYSITGVIAGESITVAPGVVANYGSADAGARIVTANFTANSNFVAGTGTLLSNYMLPTSATGPEIGRASCRERVCQYV